MSSNGLESVYVTSFARTPMGSFMGGLSTTTATDLGAAVLSAAVERAGIAPEAIDDVAMGCVLPAGLGQAPARQAAIGAGLPFSVPCSTVSKVCGSGMKAIMNGYDSLRAGSTQIVLAGGMESMSRAPYILERARAGLRLGHGRISDHMFLDGLEDAYDRGRSMGVFADDFADQYQLTREVQDEYAIESLRRAQHAIECGAFDKEVIEVGDVRHDEQPGRAKVEKIPQLRPAFRDGGTVTAANASSISDGAAAVSLMSAAAAEDRGVAPIARILGTSGFAQKPAEFISAPVGAISKLLQVCGWSVEDVDLFEINEAFAVVPLIAMRELSIPRDRLNVNGGACALGHPIGCSGARIVVTLIAALQARGLKKGVASLCIGGGEATAIGLEVT